MRDYRIHRTGARNAPLAPGSGIAPRAHGHAYLPAQKPRSSRNSRGLRRLAADDKPRDICHYPAARQSPFQVRPRRGRSGRRHALRRGRDAAPVLDLARAPGTEVRQVQGHRVQGPPRLHAFRAARVDFRPGDRKPPRHVLPERIRPPRRRRPAGLRRPESRPRACPGDRTENEHLVDDSSTYA